MERYGWFVSSTSTEKEVFHGGNTTGFTSMISMNLEKKLRIIILSNKAYVDVNTLKDTLSNVALGKTYSLPIKLKEISISSENLNRYIGIFQLSPEVKVSISKEGNQLYAQITGQGKIEIYPDSETHFFYKKVDAEITFIQQNKVINALIFKQNGQELVAEKISDTVETKKEIQVDPQILDSLVGTYELTQGFIITITKEDNKLFAQATGQQKFEIFAESEMNYFIKVVDAQILFVKDDKGVVTKAVLKQGGQELNLNKIK